MSDELTKQASTTNHDKRSHDKRSRYSASSAMGHIYAEVNEGLSSSSSPI